MSEGLRRTLPVRAGLEPHAPVQQPVERQRCRLQRATHRADDHGDILFARRQRSVSAIPLKQRGSQGGALLETEVRQRGVVDRVVLCFSCQLCKALPGAMEEGDVLSTLCRAWACRMRTIVGAMLERAGRRWRMRGGC